MVRLKVRCRYIIVVVVVAQVRFGRQAIEKGLILTKCITGVCVILYVRLISRCQNR